MEEEVLTSKINIFNILKKSSNRIFLYLRATFMIANRVFIFITMILSLSPNARAMKLTLESPKTIKEPSQDQRRIRIFRKYLAEIDELLEKHEDHEVIEIISNMLLADFYAKPGISRDEISALFNGLEAMGISLHGKFRTSFEQKNIELINQYKKRIEEISQHEKKLASEYNFLFQELEKMKNQVWDIPCIDGAILKVPFKIIALSLELKNQVEQNATISTVPFNSVIIKKLFSYLETIEHSLAQNIEEQNIAAFFAEALASDSAVFMAADILRCKYMIFNSTSPQQDAWARARNFGERENRDKNRDQKRKRSS